MTIRRNLIRGAAIAGAFATGMAWRVAKAVEEHSPAVVENASAEGIPVESVPGADAGAADAVHDTTHDAAAGAVDAAVHGAAEHSSGGLPQFDPSTYPSQIFWLALTFIVLYAFFSRKILPAISGVLENRREHIQSDLDLAEKLKAEAEKAQETYENLLANARTEATRLLNETTVEIKARADAEVQSFRDKSAADIAQLEKRLNEERRRIMQDMNGIAAEIASDAAARIAGIQTDIRQAQTVVQALNKKEAA